MNHAHKLAKIVYNRFRYGEEPVNVAAEYDQTQHCQRVLKLSESGREPKECLRGD
ncbi:MAG: hypothetical protein GXY83_38975 [Rhodopirellula sp.]|nr:hypothetical protein [Rhodopirellula sp.]